ncbi:MAG: O-antigen ligase family protein [Candidatus Andersenbacteria bacterium]|nr:O-antigen ligase family protein [Candidatus Andersenbacteria bacterium]
MPLRIFHPGMLIEIVVMLAAILLAYQARKNLWRAICMIAFLLPAYVVRLQIGGIPTNALELLILAAGTAVLWQKGTPQTYWQSLKNIPKPIKIWITLFVLAACMSTLISSQVLVSLGILKGWVFVPLLYASLVCAARPSTAQKQQLLYALVASASAVSLVALLMGRLGGRLQAFYDTPNSLALYIAPILAATFWQAALPPAAPLEARRSGDKGGRGVAVHKRRLLTAAATIQVMALIGSQSVGAAVAVFISLYIGVWLWLKKDKVKTLVVLTSLAVICAWLLWQSGKLPYLLKPIANPQTHNSATVRLQLWSISWDLIKENPVLGVGLGQFEPAYQQKLTARLRACHPESLEGSMKSLAYNCERLASEFVFRDPHNWILAFWLNIGLLGLLSFMSLNIMVLKKIRLKQDSIYTSYYLLLITVLLFGLVDTIYWKNDLSIMWWLLVAILA